MQALCLKARRRFPQRILFSLTERSDADLGTTDEVETSAPIDVARILQYARNLAAVEDLRERPNFAELLTAAAATIGPRYAGRLYELAMNESTSAHMPKLDALEWELVDGRERYRCGKRILGSQPWWTPRGGLPLTSLEIKRRARDEFFKDLPPGKKDRVVWVCAPNDENDYVAFVEYVLRRASLTDPEETKSAPFQIGMRDGLDVRATLRNWSEGTIYVREDQRGHLNFRNGAIDWINASEHSDLLTGKVSGGGWTDPDLTQLGSCSRETREADIIQRDPWIQRDHREFTFVTLDAPTSWDHSSRGGSVQTPATFYRRVIVPLVDLKLQSQKNNNLYEWLEIMFRFCVGKPFAYYSMYIPSPTIHRIAWQHKVRLVHFPLQRLPTRLLERHKMFRQFRLNREQWKEFQRRRSVSTAAWSG